MRVLNRRETNEQNRSEIFIVFVVFVVAYYVSPAEGVAEVHFDLRVIKEVGYDQGLFECLVN